ncbi:transposase family protein [Catellatospora sp. NPDC049609]|uniref:transposase family protein n=1 Tax=Catellatospora sp. NPDC049609 TaxID=3155505 RepID=UPI00341A3668
MTTSVAYTAVLDVRRETVLFVSQLLHTERRRRGTRAGTRALGCFAQAVLVLRWFLDGTRLAQLARDNTIAGSTAYRHLHEGIAVLAERKPSLHAALLAAKMAGHSHINVDGTLIHTDRCRIPGPTPGVDLYWSGKHHHHGGNIQVVSTPDGWPLWTSDVRPGREHDTTALREHAEMPPALREWTGDDLPVLADLGYEGEAATFVLPIKKPADDALIDDQRQLNWLQAYARARAEQANSLLKTTFKALRRVSLSPDIIGAIVAAAIILLHIEHGRTT